MSVSAEDLQKARRNAKRSRAFAACVPCKSARTQCADYRPCKRCADSGKSGTCVDQNETNHKKAYRFEATASQISSPILEQIIKSSDVALLPFSGGTGKDKNMFVQIHNTQQMTSDKPTESTSHIAKLDGSSQRSDEHSTYGSQHVPHGITFSVPPVGDVRLRRPSPDTTKAFESFWPSAPSSLSHAAPALPVAHSTKSNNGISNPNQFNISVRQEGPQSVPTLAALNAMTRALGAGFSALGHHQAAALPCNPVSASGMPQQLACFTSASACLSALPSQYPSICGLPAALASPPSSLVANPDRIFQPPPSMPVVSPAALLAAPSAAQRTLPGPADLYAVDRLRLLLALGASGPGPAHATGMPGTHLN